MYYKSIFLLKEDNMQNSPNRNPSEVKNTFIDSAEKLPILSEAISKSVRVAVDTETHKGSSFFDGIWSALRVISLAVKYADNTYEAFVIDYRDIDSSDLAPVMASIEVADAWNADFDDRVMKLASVPIKKWADAKFGDGVLHTGFAGFEFWHALSWAAMRYLKIEMTGKGTTQTSFDGTTDLTQEQIRYAADDAIITLWLAEKIDEVVEEAGLTTALANENAARPLILGMMENGFPFDSKRWDVESVQVHKKAAEDALETVAELTGGGALTLFGQDNTPSWDIGSDKDLKANLNRYAEEAVREYCKGALLQATDKVDKMALKQIKHPLAKAVLDYREHSKVVSTYGDNLNQYIQPDGRVHALYRQGGIVATARLASEKPNAQNLDPGMKAYSIPSDRVDSKGNKRKRVNVHADLSQAEVRVITELANEPNLRSLFEQGGDFHTLNAGKMFQVDMSTLDPETFARYRSTTKGTSFGIPYGLGASALATNLSVNMQVPTTVQEAREHISAYLKANPMVAKWLDERDNFIKNLADNPPAVDWVATFELFDLFKKATEKRKMFKVQTKRFPSTQELSELLMTDSEIKDKLSSTLNRSVTQEDIDEERSKQCDEIIWALNFQAPVALGFDGNPISWESRTKTGRRRVFTVPVDRVSRSQKGQFEGILTAFALNVATTDKPVGAGYRDEFAALHNLNLPKGVNRCVKSPNETPAQYRSRLNDFRRKERLEVVKTFEGANRWLKRELVNFLIGKMGAENVGKFLLTPALSEQIKSMSNQYRNHPIQSLVADIMFEAMANVHEALKPFEDAFAIQQVHDSLVIECYIEDAKAIMVIVKNALEQSLSKWCPSVVAKADVDVRTSLSDKSALSDEQLSLMLAA